MRIIFLLVTLALTLGARAEAASLTLACLDVGRVMEACRANAAAFTEETGHTVRVVAAASGNRLALEQYEALFAIESPRLDVLQFPDAWVPAIADDLVPLGALPASQAFISATEEAVKASGRRVGWPQHLAITVLFLRSDVVEQGADMWSGLRERLLAAPPEEASRVALGGADPALFSFFLDWFYGTGGTTLDDRAAIHKALSLLADVLSPIVAPGISRTPMSEATQSFAGGNSAALIARSTQASHVRRSELAEHIMETPLPGFRDGPQNAAVLATTWYVGTSRYSAERDAALELAAYLASEPVQRENAVQFGLAPTRKALYSEPEVAGAGPILGQIAGLLDRLAGPPAQIYGTAYLDLADSVAESVRSLLRGDLDVDEATGAVLRAVRHADRAGTN